VEDALVEIGFADLRRRALDYAAKHGIPAQGPFYVYGAGGFGQRVARELRRVGLEVAGFIDRKAREVPQADGLPCIHPEDLDRAKLRGAAFVHALMNHYAPSTDVVDWAAAQGFRDLYFPTRLCAIPGFSLENYWLAPSASLVEHLDDIEELHDRLEDEDSRALLRNLLLYRLSADPRLHPEAAVAEAYVPGFLPIFERPVTFVDGGAYTGDTLEALLSAKVRIAEWIAFEPDPENLRELRRTALAHRSDMRAFTLFEAGLADATRVVRFMEGAGEASRVMRDGETLPTGATTTAVNVVHFDDLLSRSGDIYVKLDIEGAELDALAGMQALLRQRPTLAVSVYHRPSDLWEIPRAIAGYYDKPRFRLRQHGHHAFDTVVYVMPG
jgi:FkbM family methyltransferase